LKILGGLALPTTGFVQLDGIDVQHLHPDDVRAHFGIVLQNSILFSGSLKENLLLGEPNASDEELLEAASISGVDRIASELPDGFESVLKEQGFELSGGQRQAVCIARSIIGKPAVILMDEPSSAMDSQSEQLFLSNLNSWLGDKTFVAVTHRGSLLNLVDRVIVMDAGRIVADTTKEEFFARQAAAQKAQQSVEAK